MSKIYIIPTPIGNLGDITSRAIDTLNSCDYVLAEDTRHTRNLFNAFNIKTKLISYHKFNEIKRTDEIIQELISEEKEIGIVTDAGTPCISDPGYEIVKAARENNIQVTGLPGACAAVVALSVAGINTDNFAFYGFLPRKDSELEEYLKRVRQNDIKTFVLYESPKRICNLVDMIEKVMPSCYLCVCNDLTKLHEAFTVGNVSEVASSLKNNENVEKGEYVVVGYNNEVEAESEEESKISLEAVIFDRVITKEISLKDAVREIVDEKIASKNQAYKASLNVKNFFEGDFFN